MSECTENKQNNFLEGTLTSNLTLFLQGDLENTTLTVDCTLFLQCMIC